MNKTYLVRLTDDERQELFQLTRTDPETVRHATKAWEHERNAKQTGVDWRFTTEDACLRLKRLYPQYQG